MEEAVVGAAVGASIKVLIQNILTFSSEKIVLWDCKNDLETMKKSFSMVNDFVHDAEIRQVNDNAVKRWLRELEALAFDADNVFDDIKYQLLSMKVETTKNMTARKKVLSFFSSSNSLIAYRLTLGRRIKDIILRLISINQKASEFGLKTRFAIAFGSNASGSMEIDSFTVDTIFIGRENDVSRIVEMLIITPSPVGQVLSVLPIVGMGGLGKTTLARKVFNDKKIISYFGHNRVWVRVPRIFDVHDILKNILMSLTKINDKYGNREAILKKLQNILGANKYLLVLDDIWNEDKEKWDDFFKSFSKICSATGNCMIVTTSSRKVAAIVKTRSIHELEILSGDDCWSIIEAKAFNRSQDIPSEFKTMGRNIAKKCHGLPLAAKVVGGLLCDKSKDEWREIEKKCLSDNGDGNPISMILNLRFDKLSSPSLKKCFAYCSIFPKGYEIEKEVLIELWMSEGLIQTDQGNNITMENIGIKTFNFLLHSSLLQVVKRDDYDNVTHCNMSDLVHDLASFVLKEKNNVMNGISQIRYIGYKSSGDELLSIPQGQERYMRTLFFNGKVSDIRLSNFESLHSLTLRGDDVDDLPISIKELKHLRYLDISETRIRYLPDSIGELYHMQTLRTKRKWGISYLEKLPDSLTNLISLRHLYIHDRTTLPLEIGKLTSLQTLPYFQVRSEEGCGISELGNLNDLKGNLEIRNLENVRGMYEAVSANLFLKTNIHKLKFIWGSVREVDEANDESVLEGLQPHPNLKIIEICRFVGKSLPLWMAKMAVQLDGHRWEGLDNLMEIKIEDCSECEELPMLGHLQHLKSLYLDGMRNVKSIGPSFYNMKDCNKSRNPENGFCKIVVVFRALERLELWNMPNLTEWVDVDSPYTDECDQTQLYEVRVFPRLENLTIYECKQLVRPPSHFPSLKEMHIYNMGSNIPVEKISGKYTSLTILIIQNIVDGVDYLPDEIFSNNHNLLELMIDGCPNMTRLPCVRGGGVSLKFLWIRNCRSLRELPDDLHTLNALEEFLIDWCPSLKSIPYPSSGGGGQRGFTSLRKLVISYCRGLTKFPFEMVESCAMSLEELRLEGFTNIPMVILCLHRMPRLVDLVIVGLPKFSVTLNITANNSMRRLVIGSFPDSSWNNGSYNETVDSMLLQFISLRRLELSGIEHWECLPDQLQHLNALEKLTLSRFGIEALPEWFGNLSSLETLNLHFLRNLKHLPSKQAMLRLSKLKFLEIFGCPRLLERRINIVYKYNEGPRMDYDEWPKVSHITTVMLEFHPHIQKSSN